MSLPNYCADWRSYEEGICLVYKLQNKLSDKDAVVTSLRHRFSTLADFVSSDEAIANFKLTRGQKALAKSSVEGEALERAVADATDGGERQQTALTAHRESHKTLQAAAIKEAVEMQKQDPFWNARATAVVAAAAHYPEAKIRAHIHPELFKTWLTATDGDDTEKEIKATVKKHLQRFMDDPLSPSEQLVAWSDATGGLQSKGQSTDPASTGGSRTTPTAAMETAAPWVDASGVSILDALKARLGPFLDKPEVFCYQCTSSHGTQVLAQAFMEALQADGSEARTPGVVSVESEPCVICYSSSYVLLTGLLVAHRNNCMNQTQDEMGCAERIGTCSDTNCG